MIHTLTPDELQRMLDATPGQEHLADIAQQLIDGVSPVRVDLDKLLRKPEQPAGSLPPQ